MSTQYLSASRFIRGKLVTIYENLFFNSVRNINNKHQGYKFIKHSSAINFRPGSKVGIYSNMHAKKFIIKDYVYLHKNLEYEYLHNEINTLRILNNHFLTDSKVGVPQLIKAEDKNGIITIITKYVDGQTLDHYSQDIIQRILIEVISYLHNISNEISKPIFYTIPKRSQILTYLTFPFYLLRAMIKEPQHFNLFFRCSKLFLKYTPALIFKSFPYAISHRDLSCDNILYNLKTKRITILDTECTVLTDKLYDLALLPRLYVNYFKTNQFLPIFREFHLKRSDVKRLKVLMIAVCMIKIATDRKNTRDYDNAIRGLSLVINKIIPQLNKHYE